MQSLFYIPASSSLILVPDPNTNSVLSSNNWIITDLIICGSLQEIIAVSGSKKISNFPINNTNLYYDIYPNLPEYNVISSTVFESASFSVPITFTPNLFYSSSNDVFILRNNTKATNIISQSYLGINTKLPLTINDSYTVTVSGSGQFYTSSILINNPYLNTTTAYITSSNNYITASFFVSGSEYIQVIANTETLSGIKLTYSGSVFPILNSGSLSAWNSYLKLSASYLVSGSNNVSLFGGNIGYTPSFYISGSNLSNFSQLNSSNYLLSQSFVSSSLYNFPNIASSSNLIYADYSYNLITSSLPTISDNIRTFLFKNNKVSGSIDLSNKISLQQFDASYNYFTGSIDLTRCYNLQYFDASNNRLSGSIGIFNLETAYKNIGNIQYFNVSNNNLSGGADISYLNNLQYFNISNNKFTGSVTSFANWYMQYFNCSNNLLSGSFPYLQTIELQLAPTSSLYYFNISNNNFSGTIDLYDYKDNLQTFLCNDNKLDKYYFYTGSLPFIKLTNFNAFNNLLSSSAVDNILYDLDYSGLVSGTVNLSGSGNQSPTSTGYTYTASLKSKGWTVYTN